MATQATADPQLDLVLDRHIDVPPDLVWEAWTRPEHLKQWFMPRPWSLTDCEIELRPGGAFRTLMRSPEGQEFPETGCVLEVVPGSRLVWTSLLLPGFRPSPSSDIPRFTAILSIKAEGTGTRYIATALHADEESRTRHEAMGFHDGWGKALDQLIDHARTITRDEP